MSSQTTFPVLNGQQQLVSLAAILAGGVYYPLSALSINQAAVTSGNPMPTQARNGMTVAQTSLTILANTSTPLVITNPNRRYLSILNTGTGQLNLGFNSLAVTGAGWVLAGAIQANFQGGSMTFEGAGVSTDAIYAISAAGTTVVILEGT